PPPVPGPSTSPPGPSATLSSMDSPGVGVGNLARPISRATQGAKQLRARPPRSPRSWRNDPEPFATTAVRAAGERSRRCRAGRPRPCRARPGARGPGRAPARRPGRRPAAPGRRRRDAAGVAAPAQRLAGRRGAARSPRPPVRRRAPGVGRRCTPGPRARAGPRLGDPRPPAPAPAGRRRLGRRPGRPERAVLVAPAPRAGTGRAGADRAAPSCPRPPAGPRPAPPLAGARRPGAAPPGAAPAARAPGAGRRGRPGVPDPVGADVPTGQVEAVGAATQVLQPEAPEAAPAPTADGGPPPGPGRARAPRGRPRADRRRRAAEPGPRPQLPDMPALDGLRAVALLAILAFHQGFDLAGGGFLGISSFLTLSGFLLATSMLAEWSQNGRLALGRLWLQRARRLGPPLVLTLAAVVVLQVVLRVGSGPGYKVDVLAALGQALNWRFALSDDGFARVLIDPSPVQHLWGLSVLAQLTLVLPPVFAGVMRLTGRHWRLAGALFGAAAVASFAGAAFVADRFGNESWAYFGTHRRAGGLLVGVTLGFVVLSPAVRGIVGSPRGLAALRYGAPAALLVLAVLWSTTGLYSSNLFRGVTALNA